jgi:hypothetical protein
VGSNTFRLEFAAAVEHIRQANNQRKLKLESAMQIGAVVLLGLGQDRDARGYAAPNHQGL